MRKINHNGTDVNLTEEEFKNYKRLLLKAKRAEIDTLDYLIRILEQQESK